jgi:urease accessory protein
MERDAKVLRTNKPYVFVNCKTDQGVEDVAQHITHDVLFDQPPKNSVVKTV